MPNWCANRLHICGNAGDIRNVKHLLIGDLSSRYQRAVNEGIHIFLAGCAGLLKPVEPCNYEPFPALTEAGAGESNAENCAFSRWLMKLKSDNLLTELNCKKLHEIWEQCNLAEKKWNTLSKTAQIKIKEIFGFKKFDWVSNYNDINLETWWNTLCENKSLFIHQPFNMRLVLPVRLDVEINGFNGGLLKTVPSGYSFNVNCYGVKWPIGYDLSIYYEDSNNLIIDFDTPWSPPAKHVLEKLSGLYRCSVEHYFSEENMGFCGMAFYVNGSQEEYLIQELEWADTENDESSFKEVVGPEWIINNVAHFGG